jgi:hypothetical protein
MNTDISVLETSASGTTKFVTIINGELVPMFFLVSWGGVRLESTWYVGH